MKKIFISIFLIFIFWNMECKVDPTWNAKFDSLCDINSWVYSNIEYKVDSDDIFYDFWQYPYETIQKRTGDCEDQAILFQALAKKKLGKDVVLLWIYTKDFMYCHMVVLYDDTVYDPTINTTYRLIDYANSFYILRIINNKDVKKYIKKYRGN